MGIVLIVIRFVNGIGSITNLSQEVPWGLWIGFDVVTGVAFAGGAYVVTFMVYILNIEKYKPIVRVTVLNGFLAYVFYAGALLLDLGKPWNVVNPIIGNNFGVSSVLFLVAWHFLLYMIAQLIEFSPAIAEWLGAKKARKILSWMTLGAVIFGITLSTLHQSGLGALYLMAREKIHPLWYSEFIPILFFVSSIFAGLSMVIFEGSISQRVFSDQISEKDHMAHDGIIHGLSKDLCLYPDDLFFPADRGICSWQTLDLPGFTHGGLVPGGDPRICDPAHDPLFYILPEPQHHPGKDLFPGNHGRDHHQPAECNGDRLQMGCAHTLCALLAGDCGNPDGTFH